MRKEVDPGHVRLDWLRLRWLMLGMATTAFIVLVGRCGQRLSEERESAINAPWPCRFDRGVLEECRR